MLDTRKELRCSKKQAKRWEAAAATSEENQDFSVWARNTLDDAADFVLGTK